MSAQEAGEQVLVLNVPLVWQTALPLRAALYPVLQSTATLVPVVPVMELAFAMLELATAVAWHELAAQDTASKVPEVAHVTVRVAPADV